MRQAFFGRLLFPDRIPDVAVPGKARLPQETGKERRLFGFGSGMSALEDHGIAPDIYIPGNGSIINGRDMVLEETIRVLKDKRW